MRRLLSPQALTLSAVGAVLFLVSVPRVHLFALQDNERDAVSSLITLSTPVFAAETSPPRAIPQPETWTPELRARLHGSHPTPDAGLIRRHGYLIEMGHRADGEAFLRAWPAVHGASGLHAYVYEQERGLMEHPNEGGAWSGPSSQRPDGTEAGWAPRAFPR